MGWPAEQSGSTGENVRSVQYLLNANGASLQIDGVFGPLTDAAVRNFQQSHGLTVDGIVGNETWPALIIEVQLGDTGEAVSAVQSQFNARGGLTVDGTFGNETHAAVEKFQHDLGITQDGIVGPETWNGLVSGYYTGNDAHEIADRVYTAWTHNDASAALMHATSQAVSDLFARTWSANDGWAFEKCGVATGHWVCRWARPTGERVNFEGTNAQPFYDVQNVYFTP